MTLEQIKEKYGMAKNHGYVPCTTCPISGDTCERYTVNGPCDGHVEAYARIQRFLEANPEPEEPHMNPEPEKPHIKDSGERRQFETGAVRDMSEGKGRMDLLPWAAIMEVSKHCENGAKKYGEHNVDKGIPTHSLCSSAARHLAKYMDGWTDEPHLLAAAWNLLWCIQMELKHPELCDVPWKGGGTDES